MKKRKIYVCDLKGPTYCKYRLYVHTGLIETVIFCDSNALDSMSCPMRKEYIIEELKNEKD